MNMKHIWNQHGPLVATGILVLLYGVGIGGILSDHRAWFLGLTPLILLLSAALLLLSHPHWNASFVLTVLACLAVGFGIEVVGVHTGLVFGDYAYGATLGWKWLDVPLIIGVNWLLLVYGSGMVASRLRRLPRLGRAAIAAALMTLLDLLIEPVAIHFDFWHWRDHVPPLQNYLGWFVVAFALASLFQYASFKKRNPVGLALLGLQFIFFGILNLLVTWE
jgi:uncharacterized membrane protein